MLKLEETIKMRADSEPEAQQIIDEYRKTKKNVVN